MSDSVPSAPAPSSSSDNAVLIVDDEPMVRRLVASVMERLGFEPVVAATVAEANTILKSRRFRGYLLDYHLGDGDGLSIARDIRRKEPKTPILLITGFASSSLVQEALTLGINEVLPKPFAIAELEKLSLAHFGTGLAARSGGKGAPLTPGEALNRTTGFATPSEAKAAPSSLALFLADPRKRLLAVATGGVLVGIGLTWLLLTL